MASKGKKAAPAMRKSARIAKAKKGRDEDASASSHSPGMQIVPFLIIPVLQEQLNINKLEQASGSIENGTLASTLQNDEAASTSTSDKSKLIVPTHLEQWQLII
jgi:hypothetical protein